MHGSLAVRRSTLAAALFALAAVSAAGRPTAGRGDGAARAEPCRFRLLASVDRAAVEVGGAVQLSLEVLAAPCDGASADAIEDVLDGLDLGRQLGAGFEVTRSGTVQRMRTGDVVELQRRFVVRALSDTVESVPAVRLAVRLDGRDVADATRVQRLRAFRRAPGGAEAAGQVVTVTVEGTAAGRRFRRAGSAFLTHDDALVTAYHVVANGRRVRVHLPDGREVTTSQVWVLDPARDLAVLHVDPRAVGASGLRPLPLAPPGEAGEIALTAGYRNGEQTTTVAVRYADLDLSGRRLRVTANAVGPGDSGGPLLDAAGRVLGVVVSGRATDADPDLLRQDVCLAAELRPTLAEVEARRASGVAPARLAAALAEAGRSLPAARVLEAAAALRQRRSGSAARHLAVIVDAAGQAPGDAALQFLAGSLLEEAGAAAPAQGAFEDAWDAGYFPAAYALAYGHLRQGEPAAAAALFETVRHTPAYSRLGTFGLAQALVARGRLAEAAPLLDEIVDDDGLFAPALYLLGLCHLAAGRAADAEALHVRLRRQPAWASALQLAIDAPALRPVTIEPLPRVRARRLLARR